MQNRKKIEFTNFVLEKNRDVIDLKVFIIDFDNVDISNLQRQVIHSTSEVGQNKAESAKMRVTALNPEVEVEIWKDRLTPENGMEIFGGNWDIIVDGTDKSINIIKKDILDGFDYVIKREKNKQISNKKKKL